MRALPLSDPLFVVVPGGRRPLGVGEDGVPVPAQGQADSTGPLAVGLRALRDGGVDLRPPLFGQTH